MKPIERGEVLGLADYESLRERFRARVIEEKRMRRVSLGPRITALFENRDTVLLQIQEMLRAERITRPAAVQHEIDTYNELVPGEGELSLTAMIEIVDKDEREAFLQAAAGLENHVWLVVGHERIGARSSPRAGAEPMRTTAVHYLKLPLTPHVADGMRALASASPAVATMPIEVVVDHPAYQARAPLSAALLMRLGEELRP